MKKKKVNKTSDTNNFKFGLLFGAVAVVLLFIIAITVPAITGNAFFDFARMKTPYAKTPYSNIGTGIDASALEQMNANAETLEYVKSNLNLVCEDIHVSDEDSDLTGYAFCQKEGFETCTSVISSVTATYYSSIDGSCNGDIQNFDSDWFSVPCEANPLSTNPHFESFGYGCTTITKNNLMEPILGDVQYSGESQYAICCRIE